MCYRRPGTHSARRRPPRPAHPAHCSADRYPSLIYLALCVSVKAEFYVPKTTIVSCLVEQCKSCTQVQTTLAHVRNLFPSENLFMLQPRKSWILKPKLAESRSLFSGLSPAVPVKFHLLPLGQRIAGAQTCLSPQVFCKFGSRRCSSSSQRSVRCPEPGTAVSGAASSACLDLDPPGRGLLGAARVCSRRPSHLSARPSRPTAPRKTFPIRCARAARTREHRPNCENRASCETLKFTSVWVSVKQTLMSTAASAKLVGRIWAQTQFKVGGGNWKMGCYIRSGVVCCVPVLVRVQVNVRVERALEKNNYHTRRLLGLHQTKQTGQESDRFGRSCLEQGLLPSV